MHCIKKNLSKTNLQKNFYSIHSHTLHDLKLAHFKKRETWDRRGKVQNVGYEKWAVATQHRIAAELIFGEVGE